MAVRGIETFGVGIADTITAIDLTSSAGSGRVVADSLVVVTDELLAAAKTALRARLLASRRAVPDDVRRTEADAVTEHLEHVAGDAETICAYIPVGTEPGSAAVLARLSDRGVRVLVPVALTADDGTPLPLQWGRYRPGSLQTGRFGLLEPTQPWLPADTLAQADLIVVPALAVDRRGVRLGRGAGFYDRCLRWRAPHVALVAVVRDDELLDEVPAQDHDIAMTHAVTPGRGLVALG